MLELGSKIPNFDLPDSGGIPFELEDFEDAEALLVVFWCNHCPYVKHLKMAFSLLARRHMPRGLGVVAINSNDPEQHPEDGTEEMKQDLWTYNYIFPYLIDEDQSVAKNFGAVCTPDFFLFDKDRRLVYRGRFDESSPSNAKEITGSDLEIAIFSTLEGMPVSEEQHPSQGCSIKWKPGNAPDNV